MPCIELVAQFPFFQTFFQSDRRAIAKMMNTLIQLVLGVTLFSLILPSAYGAPTELICNWTGKTGRHSSTSVTFDDEKQTVDGEPVGILSEMDKTIAYLRPGMIEIRRHDVDGSLWAIDKIDRLTGEYRVINPKTGHTIGTGGCTKKSNARF